MQLMLLCIWPCFVFFLTLKICSLFIFNKKGRHTRRVNPSRNCSFVGFRVRVRFSDVGPYSSKLCRQTKGHHFFDEGEAILSETSSPLDLLNFILDFLKMKEFRDIKIRIPN